MSLPRAVCWLAAVLLVVASCSSPHPRLIERDGPPFAEVFPEPSVLLTTGDVETTRHLLATVQLPRDAAELEELVALVEAAPSLDTEHILLITEAVPAPWGQVAYPGGGSVSWSVRWPDDEDGWDGNDSVYAELSDRLLEAGLQRWSNPGRRDLGRLLGRVRTDEALLRLSDEWLAAWDDGSVEALEDILGGMQSSPQLDIFVLQVLLPQRRLDGERQWLAVGALPFDSERVELLTALLNQRDQVSMEHLLMCLQRVTFASDRLELIGVAQPKLSSCSALELRDLMSTLSFDSDRTSLLALFTDRVTFEDARDVTRTLRMLTFASDRIKGLRLIAATPGFSVRSDELVELMALVTFDSEREDILRTAAPRLADPLTTHDLRDILRRFDYDSDRLDVLRLLAVRLAPLTPEETHRIVDLFEYEERRAEAREILGAA